MAAVGKFFLEILFGSEELRNIIFEILFMVGLWKMFEKSGVKGWWALIPGAREYKLACCAGREPEGRVYSVLTVAALLLNGILSLVYFEQASAEIRSCKIIT